jgi:hypothetical protein
MVPNQIQKQDVSSSLDASKVSQKQKQKLDSLVYVGKGKWIFNYCV